MQDNPYVPAPAEITGVVQEYSEIKTFSLRFRDEAVREEFDFAPGEFVQVSMTGVGEAPISINSSPTLEDEFRLCVERKGRVTEAMFGLEEGDVVHVRGPYGNGFPIGDVEGNNVLFVAGGIGLAPLRSAIEYIYEFSEDYGDVQIMYGDKTPTCLLFNRHFSRWESNFDLNVICESADEDWTGKEGMITDLIDNVDLIVEDAAVFTCGPPVMYKFVLPKLKEAGFGDEDIFLSFERRMECGIGKCRRCNIGDKFVCKDGPVFSYGDIKEYMDEET